MRVKREPMYMSTVKSMEEFVGSISNIVFDDTALRFLCIAKEDLRTDLVKEAEFCRDISGDKMLTSKHFKLAAKMLGI